MNADNELVSQILQGDVDSFATLMDNYKNRIYGFLIRMTYSKEDAEEILQDVFIKVYQNLNKYDKSMKFSTWIFAIAANTFKTAYRKKKQAVLECSIEEIPMDIRSFENSPDIQFELKESYIEVIKLFSCLKSDQKMAVLLKHIHDFSYKEIGEILGISAEAAKMKVQRAKQTLGERYLRLQRRGVAYEM